MATTQPRPVVDLFDIVQPVCAEDSPAVHLAPHDWDRPDGDRTLCGLPVSDVRPEKTYAKHGCLPCAVRAVGAGIFAVRESDGSVINLSRFIDARMPRDPTSDGPS